MCGWRAACSGPADVARGCVAGQADLLDWQPPEPVVSFPARAVQASTVTGRLAKAVSAALAGRDRALVARSMSDYLGRTVSKHMVDAYASQGRDDHTISAPRYMALTHATEDRRLLELLAEPMGWSVIERRYLPLIQLAAVREREDRLRREGEVLRRLARSGGLI